MAWRPPGSGRSSRRSAVSSSTGSRCRGWRAALPSAAASRCTWPLTPSAAPAPPPPPGSPAVPPPSARSGHSSPAAARSSTRWCPGSPLLLPYGSGGGFLPDRGCNAETGCAALQSSVCSSLASVPRAARSRTRARCDGSCTRRPHLRSAASSPTSSQSGQESMSMSECHSPPGSMRRSSKVRPACGQSISSSVRWRT